MLFEWSSGQYAALFHSLGAYRCYVLPLLAWHGDRSVWPDSRLSLLIETFAFDNWLHEQSGSDGQTGVCPFGQFEDESRGIVVVWLEGM